MFCYSSQGLLALNLASTPSFFFTIALLPSSAIVKLVQSCTPIIPGLIINYYRFYQFPNAGINGDFLLTTYEPFLIIP